MEAPKWIKIYWPRGDNGKAGLLESPLTENGKLVHKRMPNSYKEKKFDQVK